MSSLRTSNFTLFRELENWTSVFVAHLVQALISSFRLAVETETALRLWDQEKILEDKYISPIVLESLRIYISQISKTILVLRQSHGVEKFPPQIHQTLYSDISPRPLSIMWGINLPLPSRSYLNVTFHHLRSKQARPRL